MTWWPWGKRERFERDDRSAKVAQRLEVLAERMQKINEELEAELRGDQPEKEGGSP